MKTRIYATPAVKGLRVITSPAYYVPFLGNERRVRVSACRHQALYFCWSCCIGLTCSCSCWHLQYYRRRDLASSGDPHENYPSYCDQSGSNMVLVVYHPVLSFPARMAMCSSSQLFKQTEICQQSHHIT